MTTAAPLQRLVHKLVQAAERRSLEDLADRELLDRFRAQGDAEAFATIVRRHGPCVLAACRKVLSSQADVEDAFQATFVVLLRTPGAVRQGTALRSWLYGVAHRVALKVVRASARRRRAEQQQTSATQEAPDLSWREACAILHEELDRLPDQYRLPLLVCYLDGKTRDEAAQELGVKLDVLRGRLERGRNRLRSRLTKRGVFLSAGLLAAVAGSATAVGPADVLVRATLQAGIGGEVGGNVAALLRGAMAPATFGKYKLAVAAIVAVVLASGALGVALHTPPPETPPASAAATRPAADAKKPAEPAQDETTATVECRGRVLDPHGESHCSARVTFYQKRPRNELPDFFPQPVRGASDPGGEFHFPATYHPDAPNRGREPQLVLVAVAPGYGPAALEVTSADKLKDCKLRLVEDDVPLEGRILNLEGKPVAGVTVRPLAVVLNTANDLGPWIKARAANKWNELGEEYRTNTAFAAAAVGLKDHDGLAAEAVTDENGKFTLTGFGRERVVVLRVDGPTIETRLLNVLTRKMPPIQEARDSKNPLAPEPEFARPETNTFHGAQFDFAPGVGMTVEGIVKDADTGKPLADVVVRSQIPYDFGWAEDELTTTTDADGRYRLPGLGRRKGQYLEFVPAAGQPVFRAVRPVEISEIDKPAKLDVALHHGIPVTGHVTDKATGKPVQAVVEYLAFRDNPDLNAVKDFRGAQAVSSAKDGSFRLVALPGRGIVTARTDEMRRTAYLYGQGAEQIKGFDAKEGRFETAPYLTFDGHFDSVVGIEPGAKAEAATCELKLDPGKTVKGRLLDPDGKPLTGVHIRGPFGAQVNVRNLPTADFLLTAVNPAKPEAYYFTHDKKHLAAVVVLKGDEPEGFTVKLQPTATITGRLVTADGEPARNVPIVFQVDAGQLNLTRSWNGILWSSSDADGRFTIEGVLPSVSLSAQSQHREIGWAAVVEKLTLKPGEKHAVGDVTMKPLKD